jgi:threonine dehydratase
VVGEVPEEPRLALKLEGLQPTGSFKVRGALAALDDLDPSQVAIAASAGNHALGVAYAASRLGRRVTVVTSTRASVAKIAAIKRFDVDLVQVGTSYDDAEAHALSLAAVGGRFVSAYNDPQVIAGQGSIGIELESQLEGPLTVVCGVGGGGLASGLGLWASTRPDVRVVGVEAEASRALSTAVRAGHQVTVPVGDSLADGMVGNIEPGSVTVALIAQYVSELVTVSEKEIRNAIRYLAQERGVVSEGAGAAPVAAVLAGRLADGPGTVAVVSGRNIGNDLLISALKPGGPDDQGRFDA